MLFKRKLWFDLTSNHSCSLIFYLLCLVLTVYYMHRKSEPKTDDQIRLKPPELHPKLQNMCTESLIQYKLQSLRGTTHLYGCRVDLVDVQLVPVHHVLTVLFTN